jgi:hypothetical protein
MLYREIIAVCSQIHTEHINTLCGKNVELLNVKRVVHIVTSWGERVNPTIINKSPNASPISQGYPVTSRSYTALQEAIEVTRHAPEDANCIST